MARRSQRRWASKSEHCLGFWHLLLVQAADAGAGLWSAFSAEAHLVLCPAPVPVRLSWASV
jgi:hypothetical protein